MVHASAATASHADKATIALMVVSGHVDPIALARALEQVSCQLSKIVLLGVRPEPDTVRARGIMKDTVVRHLESDARASLEPIQRSLAAEGIESTTEVRLSDDPRAILEVARKLGCRTLFVASRPLAGARQRWLSAMGCVGSHLGARMAALSEIPVVILPVEAARS